VEPADVAGYALEWRLGSGGFSEVWKGRHRVTGTVAAIKLVREDAGAGAQELIEQEARALARLQSPHVVSVFDHGHGFLVMSFIEGRSLEIERERGLTPQDVVALAIQIGSALAHAHERGVIHRDVKPANVLVDRRGNAYLADFGMAQLDSDSAAPPGGTPAYMPPEQLHSGRAMAASDQYSLARSVLALLGANVEEMHDSPLADLAEELGERFAPALLPALESEPARRWASMSHFVEAIAAIDLAALGAPEQVAPRFRSTAEYAWCSRAERVEVLSPRLERADFSLASLVEQGALPAAARRKLTERCGLEELPWSIYGRRDRLGSLAEATAPARARQLVVLLAGLFYPRSTWRPLAEAVVRDNPLTLVIAPDWMGFDGSRFVEGGPSFEQVSPASVMRSLLELLDVLGLRALPTVIVGHSAATLPVLSLRDDELGSQTSRLAVAPPLPHGNPAWRRRIALLLATFFFMPPLCRHLVARTLRRTMAPLSRDVLTPTLAAAERHVNRSMRPFWRHLMSSRRPEASGAALRRCIVVASLSDPYLAPQICDAALSDLDFNLANRHWSLDDTHYPHLPNESHPEGTACNLDQLVRLIDMMLLDAREGAGESDEPKERIGYASPSFVEQPTERAKSDEPAR
jgi:serine/threonine protein kinase